MDGFRQNDSHAWHVEFIKLCERKKKTIREISYFYY